MYQVSGWSFERNNDGSLAIITSDHKTLNVPKNELQKLVSFAITGEQNNQQVIESVRNLQESYQTQTTSPR